MTQSGMSVLVRALEGQLGFRLFDRTTRKVTLTEFGTRFLPIADRSVLELEGAASVIGRAASIANRQLAIGATPLIASKLLPTAIGDYAVHRPDLKIVLHDGDRSRVIAMTLSGEIDVGLGCFLQPVSGVRRIPLFRFSLMLIEPAARPASGAPRCWKDIVGSRLISMPPDNPIQQVIDRNLQRFGRHDPPGMVFDYFETQIAMVEAGAACAVVPTFAIPVCRNHRIAMHPLVDPLVPIELYQIASRGRKLPTGFEDFSRFLRSYIAEWAEPWTRRPG